MSIQNQIERMGWITTIQSNLPRVSISVANQIVASGTNFLLALYLVRTLPPEQFGWYGIGFALVLLYSGVGNALFITQMVVRMPEETEDNRPQFCADMLMLVVIFAGATIILSALLSVLVAFEHSRFILAVTLASVSMLLTNYFVRYAYSIRRETGALYIHSLSAVTLIIGLIFFHSVYRIETAADALVLYSIGHLTGALSGYAWTRLPIRKVSIKRLHAALRRSFGGGKWALGGVGVTWLQSQSYVYLTALFMGPAGVAVLNAGRLLVAPFTFLLPALTNLVLPRLADIRVQNPDRLLKLGILYAIGLLVAGTGYLLILSIVGHWVIPIAIGDKYDHSIIYWIAIAWGIALLPQLAKTAASLVLQAKLEFRILTLDSAIAALATILAALAFLPTMGLYGAIIAIILGETLLAGILWHRLRKTGAS